MRIEINPRSLLNLKHICEVLYCLHPSVLDDLVEMERDLGSILGTIHHNNLSMEERELLSSIDFDKSEEVVEDKSEEVVVEDKCEKDELNSYYFHELRKYIQLNTDEYIPMKIYVEVEDYVIGRKVRELVRALEKTRALEQFYLHKKEIDEDAYFAEGYNLTMNEEQRKKFNNFFWSEDSEALEELLRREKLYP